MSQALIAFLLLLIPLLGVVGGVALAVRARWKRRGYPACGGCGYDVSRTVGVVARCPECGAAFTEVGIVPPRRRSKPRPALLAWSVVTLLLVTAVLAATLLHHRATIAEARAAQMRAAMQQALAPAPVPAAAAEAQE